MKLNQYQQAAVNEPPKNITVSAAAGSGKTQVLGARVLQRISGENPVPVNRLLIVTFTKAAAAEMRSRISKSIADALRNETDQDKRQNLQKQLSLLGGADICTIDSFCSRILRQNFFRVPGLSSDFTLGDEKAAELISAECFKRVAEMFGSAADMAAGKELLPYYKQAAEEFFALYTDEKKAKDILEGFRILSMNYGSARNVSDFSSSKNNGTGADYVNFVYKIKSLVLSLPNPQEWLDLCIRDYDPETPLRENRINKYGCLAAGRIIDDCIYMLENELTYGALNDANTRAFTVAIERLKEIKKPETYDDAVEIFAQKPLGGIRIAAKDTAKAKGNPNASRLMKRIRDDIWAGAEDAFCGKKGDRIKKGDFEAFRKEIYLVVLALCEIVRCLIAKEEGELLDKKKLSFSACVKLTLELLVNPDGSPTETALELREHYDEIYVDEAQDIDPRQKAIFEAISKGNLFMVGDVKQSIYGFRHAEPRIFNSRCNEQGENSKLIKMNVNYRSNSSVVDIVNRVFSKLMNKHTIEADYNEMHRMEHGESWLPKENPKAEFIAVVGGENAGTKYNFELEGQLIANEINRLLDEGVSVYDKKREEIRPIMKKDIIVLLRAVSNDGPILEKILEENNIACYFDGGEGLFGKSEISAVTDVLSLIDNPKRDIPLAGMLRGLMFGFSENDLLRIRSVSGNKKFSRIFSVLCREGHPRHEEYAQRLEDDDLLKRCVQVGTLLEKWRICAAYRPVSEVIGMILDDTEFYATAGAMKNGEKRRANLDLLIDEARRFEADGSKGLYEFLNHIKKQSFTKNGSVTEAKTLSDSMDVVRIMSIHKSKGLEAPVVFLGKCKKDLSNNNNSLAINGDLGFSTDYRNEDKGYLHHSPMSKIINLCKREKECFEEVRLLYVAMTRPRERLICTGYFSSEKALEDCLSMSGDATMSDILFSRGNFTKMLGDEIGGGAMALKTVWEEEISPPKPWKKLEGADFLKENTAENFSDLLGFSYGYRELSRLPAKLSVSAIKEAAADEEAASASYGKKDFIPPLRKPSFLESKPEPTAAEIGTAYHLLMENLSFARSAKEQLEDLVKNGTIPKEAAEKISTEKIQEFMESSLGQRMKKAVLYREAPFMMKLPANEVLPLVEVDTEEKIAVQGIIDCYFIEKDTVVIVDYKTDKYENPQDIAEKYKKQLELYEKAIKMKFSDKKIQKYLYLFYKNDIIEI